MTIGLDRIYQSRQIKLGMGISGAMKENMKENMENQMKFQKELIVKQRQMQLATQVAMGR